MRATATECATTAVPGEDGIEFPNQERGDWFVLRTRSRQEKILANTLRSREVGCFLPLLRAERIYCGRRFVVELPLFPCYVFLRGQLDDAYFAERTKRVAQIIQVPDQRRLDCELSNLARALSSNQPLDPFPYLRTGIRVEVREGPLRGIQGIIEDRTRRDRLILQIEALGQAVSLEVDAAAVDVIE